MSRITAADLEAFVQIFQASDWDEVDVNVGDLALHLSRSDGQVIPRYTHAEPIPEQLGSDAGQVIRITAPHFATVHLGASPGGDACVRAGDIVTANSVICTLQVMQRFIPVKAGVNGTIREVATADGANVQFGELLFALNSAVASAGTA